VPQPQPHEVLIKVHYAALNRADLFQKAGSYPPPEGGTPILGLECSGEIVAVGSAIAEEYASPGKARREALGEAQRWGQSPLPLLKQGDHVAALLEGGGYAEYVACAASQMLPIPSNWDLREAAALPEALFTVWLALFHTADVQPGEVVLIHGGASGIGSTAIQMLTAFGAKVIITAGSDEKAEFCRQLGATLAINYRTQDFAAIIAEQYPQGVNIILDFIGADYYQKNLKLLAPYGRIVSLAFLTGAKAEVNMAPLLLKQASWHGLTLRSRSIAQKAVLAQEIRQHCWQWLEERRLIPQIDSEFPLVEAEKAHKHMEQNLNLGKILLKVAA